MAEREIDLLGGAIAATEMEIFGEATDGKSEPLDDTGDRSVEDMGEGLEGQHEEEEGEEGQEQAGGQEQPGEESEGDEDDQPRGEDGRFRKKEEQQQAPKDAKDGKPDKGERVPVRELLSEREKRQAAEAERDAAKKETAALNSKLDDILRRLEAAEKPQPKPEQTQAQAQEPPDVFTDPVGFMAHIEARQQAKLDEMRAGMSMEMAHTRHGEKFEAAYKALTSLDPKSDTNRQLVQSIYRSANPGEAIVRWHNQQEALRRVGSDPDAYEAKVREETRKALAADPEFRKQLLTELQAEASGRGRNPNPPVRLPKSLNSAAGGSQRIADPDEFDNSDASVFGAAFR